MFALLAGMLALAALVSWAADTGYRKSEEDRKNTERQNRNLIILADGLVKQQDKFPNTKKLFDLAKTFVEDPEEDRFRRIPKFAADLDENFAELFPLRRVKLFNELQFAERETREIKLKGLTSTDSLSILKQKINNDTEINKLIAWLKTPENGREADTGDTAEVSDESSTDTVEDHVVLLVTKLVELTLDEITELVDRLKASDDIEGRQDPNPSDLYAKLHELNATERASLGKRLWNLGNEQVRKLNEAARKFLELPQVDRFRLDRVERLNLLTLSEVAEDESGLTLSKVAENLSKAAEDVLNFSTPGQSANKRELIGALTKFIEVVSELEQFVFDADNFPEFLIEDFNPAPEPLAQRYYKNALHDYNWRLFFILFAALELWLFCRLVVDVNRTSIHGLYRDRLASAYLVGLDTKGDVDIEEDINLEEIGCYEVGSKAPYHLINVALNLQGSKALSIRDRNSDFFIFSKKFIGGDRTGYCRSATLENIHPQMSLATAMAISAAAASPNMGRGTSPALVAFMVLLNIRLGYWLPNPGLLEETLFGSGLKKIKREPKTTKKTPPGFNFLNVFEQELSEITKRWNNVYPNLSELKQRELHATKRKSTTTPTTKHDLVGIGFSGGGIRSATINLGIAQALHSRGVFDHVDYMSTVSGGGYLGSSLSTLMRRTTKPVSEIAGKVRVIGKNGTGKIIVQDADSERVYPYSKYDVLAVKDGDVVQAGQRLIRPYGPRLRSEIKGKVTVNLNKGTAEKIVTVTPAYGEKSSIPASLRAGISWVKARVFRNTDIQAGQPESPKKYLYSKHETLAVKDGDVVKAGQVLIERHNALWDRFRWRVRPSALVREMMMRLNETYKWVNLSDGGHIENLAGIELLRRRCKFIIIGDGEADPELSFNGLATLIRYARIDLGIIIDIDTDAIRLDKSKKVVDKGTDNLSREHWAFGTITYPPNEDNGHKQEEGYLLYLKSSYTGDEDEVIKEYRHRKPAFPHESTADQFFSEDQFECYRALGQHIGEQALEHAPVSREKLPFSQMDKWFTALRREQAKVEKLPRDKAKAKKQSAANSQ